jgi:hypothetical protein
MQNSQPKHLTTDSFAESLGVKGATVRRGLCIHGHYMGIRPVKLPNNRLLWPADERDRLLKGETIGEPR